MKMARISRFPCEAPILLLVAASAAQVNTFASMVDLGQSTQNLVLTGLGANGAGDGTYDIQQGSCSSATGMTTCILSGVISGSTPQGFSPGTYSLLTTFAASDVMPVQGTSQSPGSNLFVYDFLAPDLSIILNLDVGGANYVEPLVTAGNFDAGAAIFFTYTGTETCIGLATCTQANVGVDNGAVISGPVTISASFPSTVPEPSSFSFVGLSALCQLMAIWWRSKNGPKLNR
jgi:hypothetical protein